MRLLNTKNPEDVAKIFPWLIETDTENRMDIAAELYCRLKHRPEDTLLLVAIERNITRAVLIAHISDNKKKYVWLWQSHAEPGFKYSKLMFDALKGWAKDKGVKEIRMGTDGREKAFEKRWGFEPLRNGDMKLKIA